MVRDVSRWRSSVLLSLAIGLPGLGGCAHRLPQAEDTAYYRVETRKPYDDVMAELQIAIAEENFRITGHNEIGRVIRKRDNLANFPDYDTLQFCNLDLARKMLEIDPEAVRYMPCNIALYGKEQGPVVIMVHLLPLDNSDARLNDFFSRMNERLKHIADFAAE